MASPSKSSDAFEDDDNYDPLSDDKKREGSGKLQAGINTSDAYSSSPNNSLTTS